MRHWQIDKKYAAELAQKLDLKVLFQSNENGVIVVDKDGNEEKYEFEDFFSELKELKDI